MLICSLESYGLPISLKQDGRHLPPRYMPLPFGVAVDWCSARIRNKGFVFGVQGATPRCCELLWRIGYRETTGSTASESLLKGPWVPISDL